MTDTKTWADGFGIWHATVPAEGDARRRARRAIRRELQLRQDITDYSVRVDVEDITLNSTGQPLTLTYRERDAR